MKTNLSAEAVIKFYYPFVDVKEGLEGAELRQYLQDRGHLIPFLDGVYETYRSYPAYTMQPLLVTDTAFTYHDRRILIATLSMS